MLVKTYLLISVVAVVNCLPTDGLGSMLYQQYELSRRKVREIQYGITTFIDPRRRAEDKILSESLRVINLIFATYSLRASMIVLLFICSVVIYHVLLLVIRDLWKAHRELAASLGLDQCDCSYYWEGIDKCFRRYCLSHRNNQDL